VTGPRVVAIDGAAGSGKSTLARALAAALGLPYVNTGSMYRALTAEAIRGGVDLDDASALVEVIRGLTFRIVAGSPPELEVEGWDAGALTEPSVEAQVSRAARHPEVRALMRALQRGFGEEGGAVMEGRDIGTVVFPDAALKLFLRADPGTRAARRRAQRAADEVEQALRARDELDARVNPLEPAPDAVVLDTTSRSADETLELALRLAREALA
jgi:cytidylate kinase